MSLVSLWRRILDRIENVGLDLRKRFDPTPPTDTVAFSISFIALAAKMAKADGVVTRDEVTMFRRIFVIPPEEEQNAARVYNLCRQDTTGYRTYAQKMSRALDRAPNADDLREDVLDALFHIAMADGEYHANEDRLMQQTAEIFGLQGTVFQRLKARHVPDARDPYSIVGVTPDVSEVELREVRRQFLLDNHPDRLIARGLPPEMMELATARVADFMTAFDEVLEDVEARR